MTTKALLILLLVFLMVTGLAFSYELVLKNGKTIKGKMITESEDLIVMEDDSGVRMNFKKVNVDLEKTAAANQVKEPRAAPPPSASEPKKEETEQQTKPKKASRKYTERDIYRLRSKSALSEMSSTEAAEAADSKDAKEEKTEEYWKQTSQDLLSQMKEAEAAYKEMTAGCQKLQGATIQTHRVYDARTGETLDMQETTQGVCEQAEQAKAAYEEAKSGYEAFQEEARQEVVPPGWVAAEEE